MLVHPLLSPHVEVATEGCWLWSATKPHRSGYVRISRDGRVRAAHRWVYEQLVGPIAHGLTIDHVCHNRSPACNGGNSCRHRRCVNPAHLEAVSLHENIRRAVAAGRRTSTREVAVPTAETMRLARRGRSLTRRIAAGRFLAMEREGIARRLHSEHGWSHAEIAQAIGVSRPNITRMLKD